MSIASLIQRVRAEPCHCGTNHNVPWLWRWRNPSQIRSAAWLLFLSVPHPVDKACLGVGLAQSRWDLECQLAVQAGGSLLEIGSADSWPMALREEAHIDPRTGTTHPSWLRLRQPYAVCLLLNASECLNRVIGH